MVALYANTHPPAPAMPNLFSRSENIYPEPVVIQSMHSMRFWEELPNESISCTAAARAQHGRRFPRAEPPPVFLRERLLHYNDQFVLRSAKSLRLLGAHGAAGHSNLSWHIVVSDNLVDIQAEHRFSIKKEGLWNHGVEGFVNIREQGVLRMHGDTKPWHPVKQQTGRHTKFSVRSMDDTRHVWNFPSQHDVLLDALLAAEKIRISRVEEVVSAESRGQSGGRHVKQKREDWHGGWHHHSQQSPRDGGTKDTATEEAAKKETQGNAEEQAGKAQEAMKEAEP